MSLSSVRALGCLALTSVDGDSALPPALGKECQLVRLLIATLDWPWICWKLLRTWAYTDMVCTCTVSLSGLNGMVCWRRTMVCTFMILPD